VQALSFQEHVHLLGIGCGLEVLDFLLTQHLNFILCNGYLNNASELTVIFRIKLQ